MSLLVPLSQESTTAVPVNVEVDVCEGTVYLTVPPDAKYPDFPRNLLPDEARAIAAALVHYAQEAER